MQEVHVSAAVACFETMTSVQPAFHHSQQALETIQSLLDLRRIHSYECYVDIPACLQEVAAQLLISFSVIWPCSLGGCRVDFNNDQRPAFLFMAVLRHLLTMPEDQRSHFCVHFRRAIALLLQKALV